MPHSKLYLLYSTLIFATTHIYGASVPTATTNTTSSNNTQTAKPWLYRNNVMAQPFCTSMLWDFRDNQVPSTFSYPSYSDVKVQDGVLQVTMNPSKENSSFGDSPKVTSGDYYFLYGTMTVRMKVQAIAGVVSYFTMIANGTNDGDGRDEIDWEFVGNKANSVDSNIFANHHVIYDKYAHTNSISNTEQWHNYTVDWSTDKIRWLIDGKTVYESNPTYDKTVNDWIYPVTPLHLSFGLWDASSKASWTGGVIDWNKYRTSGIKIEIDSIRIDCNYNATATPPTPYVNPPTSVTKPPSNSSSQATPTGSSSSLSANLIKTTLFMIIASLAVLL